MNTIIGRSSIVPRFFVSLLYSFHTWKYICLYRDHLPSLIDPILSNTRYIVHASVQLLFLSLIYCRYVPIDDLVNIYEELYGQSGLATAEVIENCTRFLFLERLAPRLDHALDHPSRTVIAPRLDHALDHLEFLLLNIRNISSKIAEETFQAILKRTYWDLLRLLC